MKINVKRMCTAAVAIAVIFIGTYIVQIPIPGGSGYVNLGDSFVFLFSCILPAPYAIAAAAVGPALADLAGGFVLYAPFTLVIKGLMAK